MDELEKNIEAAIANPSPPSFLSGFGQADQILANAGVTETTGEEPVKLEQQDIEGLVQMPFDIAAIVTKFDGFELEEEQIQTLSRLFLKPIQRLLPKTKNLDLIIACSTLAGIATEKYLAYQVHNSNKAGNKGTGENEQHQS